MKKYLSILFALSLCLSLVGVTFSTSTIASGQDGTGTVSGTVYQSDGVTPIANLAVYATALETPQMISGTLTDGDGNYTLHDLPTGSYKVGTYAPWTGLMYFDEWYDDVHDWNEATPVSVTAPADTQNINFNLEPAGTISGTVYESDGVTPISNLHVYATDFESGAWMVGDNTDASGNYTLTLPVGSYKVRTSAANTGLFYIDEWYNDKYSGDQADPVLVTATEDTTGIDFALEPAGTISGHVTDGATSMPIPNLLVYVTDLETTGAIAWAVTNAGGNYTLNLLGGSYKVRTYAPWSGLSYIDEWYDNVHDWNEATPVEATVGQDNTGIDFTLEPFGTISGYVTDNETGEAVSGAKIDVFDYASLLDQLVYCGSATTDDNGYYVTTGLPAGEYEVRVSATGYATERYQDTYIWLRYQDNYVWIDPTPVSVTPPGNTGNINFSLEAGGTISGNVTDAETGQPISTVRLAVLYLDLSGRLVDVTLETDGSYRLEGLPPGDYLVWATATDYAVQYYDGKDLLAQGDAVTVVAGETTGIDFTLRYGAGGISGHVYEADGITPIARALVQAYAYDGATWTYAFRWWSRSDGSYSIGAQLPGDYKVKVVPGGYAEEWYQEKTSLAEADTVYIAAGANTTDIDFTLEPWGTISGTVYEADGETPIANLLVYATDLESPNPIVFAVTNASGNYTFALPEGSYKVRTYAPWSGLMYFDEWYDDVHDWNEATPVQVTVGQDNTGIDFNLEPLGTISGTVYQEDGVTPIANLHVYAVDYDTALRMADANTNESGEYTLIVPTGTYCVRANPSGSYAAEYYEDTYIWQNRTSVPVTAPDDTSDINFTLEPGRTISGRVTDTLTEEGVSGATIVVRGYDSLHPGKGWLIYSSVTTNANGYYVSTGLPAGEYGVRIQAEGYASEWYQDVYPVLEATPIEVTMAADIVNIDFSLESGGTISGHVYQSDNTTAIEGALIIAYDYPLYTGLEVYYVLGSTGADGSYTTVGLPTGIYAIHVSADGYASEFYQDTYCADENLIPVSVNATADTPDIDFSLEPGGTISGHVYESDGTTPFREAHIRVYDYGSLPDLVYYGWVWIGEDGSYTTVSLPTGIYAVWVEAEGYITEWYNNTYNIGEADCVSVTVGQDTSGIDFALSQPHDTPTGDSVTVIDEFSGVTLVFDEVTEGGITSVNVSEENPGGDTAEFEFLSEYYDIYTEASYNGTVTVTIAYSDEGMTPEEENELRLYHWTGLVWEDVTVSLDTENNLITGEVPSLSWLAVGIPPQVTWLPPLSTEEVYLAQDGSTVPIKFQLTDAYGNLVSDASVMVTVTRDIDGEIVLSGLAVYEPDISGYRINAQTKDWTLGEYTIHLSVNQDARYGLSIMQMGQAKGKQK